MPDDLASIVGFSCGLAFGLTLLLPLLSDDDEFDASLFNLASMHCPILSKNDLYKVGLVDKSVDPYQNTSGFVLGNIELEDDALDSGEKIVSADADDEFVVVVDDEFADDVDDIDMGDAVMVPGMESIFCEMSKSTKMGVRPSLTAVCLLLKKVIEDNFK